MWPGPRPTPVQSGILIICRRFATIVTIRRPELRVLCPSGAAEPLLGELARARYLTQCGLGRGLPPYQVAC